jgi:hypothetical protein
MMAAGAIIGSVASVGGLLAKPKPGTPAALTREQFSRWVGSTFKVHREALTVVPVCLARVTDTVVGRRSKPLPGHDQFSLVFHGPADLTLPQQTYRMEHPEAGVLAIFIVPMERRGDVQTYEAVFHHPAAGA